MGAGLGWPIWSALIWSSLVTLGCFLAVSCIDYPEVRTTTDFVELVRNIAIMGAAAIALPVSLYTLWMKDTGFRSDLKKTIREEIERQHREMEERQELERKKRTQHQEDLMRQIVEFVGKNPSCTFPEIRSAFPNPEKQDLESAILKAHDQEFLDAPSKKITAFEGSTLQFGRISLAHKGRDLLRGSAPD